jgi:hypothetical protein
MTVVLTRKTHANAAAVDWLASRPCGMWWLILSLAHKHILNLNFTCGMPPYVNYPDVQGLKILTCIYLVTSICVPVSVVGLSAESTLFKVIRNQRSAGGYILFADLILIHLKYMLTNNFEHNIYVWLITNR